MLSDLIEQKTREMSREISERQLLRAELDRLAHVKAELQRVIAQSTEELG